MNKSYLEKYFNDSSQKLIEDLEKNPNLHVDINIVDKRGFSGEIITIIVISVVLNGLLKGILSSIGSDIWGKIKELFSGISSDKKKSIIYEKYIRVEVQLQEINLTLTCPLKLVDEENEEKMLLEFNSNLQDKVKEVASISQQNQEIGKSGLKNFTFEFTIEGKWRQI